jgi:3-oxoacyl-[acyl-carrier protein] reductase
MEAILNNKIAVVYGAGSIGGAVAPAFAKAGATVFVADHHEDALTKLADKHVQTVRLDVLDKDAVAAFVKAVVEQTGHGMLTIKKQKETYEHTSNSHSNRQGNH